MTDLLAIDDMLTDHKLYWVTSRAPASSVLPDGFPIIVDELTRVVCEPALLYLHETFISGNSNTIVDNTLNAQGEDLKEWFRFCEEFELSWTDATEGDITAFCKAMRATISPLTGKKYSTHTINRRKSTILQFYTWARSNKIYRTAPTEDSLLDPDLAFEPASKRIRKPLKLLAVETAPVSVMQRGQCRRILDAIGPLPNQHTAQVDSNATSTAAAGSGVPRTTKSSRDRIATQTSLETGMRISEVCGLPLQKFDNLSDPASNTAKVHIRIVGKGNKTRRVDFPGWLVREIKTYICNERQEILTALNIHKAPKALFINPLSSGKHAGKPLQVRTLERAFADGCLSAGETKVVKIQKFDCSGISTVHYVTEPLFCYHDTRHTYAVWTYYVRKTTEAEPWLYIQARLGHATLETTLKKYLKVAGDFEPDVSDQYMKSVKPNA